MQNISKWRINKLRFQLSCYLIVSNSKCNSLINKTIHHKIFVKLKAKLKLKFSELKLRSEVEIEPWRSSSTSFPRDLCIDTQSTQFRVPQISLLLRLLQTLPLLASPLERKCWDLKTSVTVNEECKMNSDWSGCSEFKMAGKKITKCSPGFWFPPETGAIYFRSRE